MTLFSSFRPASSSISDDLLSAHLDGRLSAAERERVQQAAAADADVQQRLRDLEATVQVLRSAPRVAVPRAFVLSERDVRAVSGRRSGLFGRALPALMPMAAAAVAVMLVILVGLDLGLRSASMLPPPAPTASSAPQQSIASITQSADAPAPQVMEVAKAMVVTVAVANTATAEPVAATAVVEEALPTTMPEALPPEPAAPVAAIAPPPSSEAELDTVGRSAATAADMGAVEAAPTLVPELIVVTYRDGIHPSELRKFFLAQQTPMAIPTSEPPPEPTSEPIPTDTPPPVQAQVVAEAQALRSSANIASKNAAPVSVPQATVVEPARVLGLPDRDLRVIEFSLAVLFIALLGLTWLLRKLPQS